jgi:ABC-type polysaccharide/polyol phosphate transport system ATPase subunit
VVALAFEEVEKHYRGALFTTDFREDVWAGLRRLVRRQQRNVIRALDGVSFQVKEGESYALLGHNGAGKTTALKLATRVTFPTGGRIRVRGRVGALIEVGSGLHPDLNGRENIHLYGSIMGLSKADIRKRFDQIVEFSGVGAALNQPLKQFSSGMQLRLGFSVAAFLEPDVLLVDEAISVGDAQFQAQCVARMKELTREGRTLIFVSHDMYAIEALCDRAVWLRHGRVVEEGPTAQVIRGYLMSAQDERLMADPQTGAVSTPDLDIVSVLFADSAGQPIDRPRSGEPVSVRIHYNAKRRLDRPGFSVGLSDGGLHPFAIASMVVDGEGRPDFIEGEGVVECQFAELPLQPRSYELWASVRTADDYSDYIPWQRLRVFTVEGEIGSGGQAVTSSLTEAPVKLRHTWLAE